MRRVMIAGSVSAVLVLTTLALLPFIDSGPSPLLRLPVFIFLQYPAMLIGYVTGGEANIYALAIVAWVLWGVIMYAALWFAGTFVDGLRAADRPSGHA